jgi:cytochrome c peroxidase
MNRRLRIVASFFAMLLAVPASGADSLRDQARGLFGAIPKTPPALPGETATPEKAALGRMLFFEPRISENHDLSCAGCHNLSLGGVDPRASALAHGGELGGRKVLTVLNAVFNASQYYDGRAADLKDQVGKSVMANPAALLKTRGGPMMVNPAELNVTKQHAVERLKAIPGYADPFKKAFPEDADPVSYDNVARAIAAFEATLITPDSPFDRWLNGDDAALAEEQKQGLKLFMDKGCAGCHDGVNFGGGKFARFGAVQSPPAEFLPPEDTGRFAVTRTLADKYVFKVPGLRNVELTAPYFHTGRARDLKQAAAVMGEAQLGVKLTDAETSQIAAFLKSLTGRQPDIALPILPATPQDGGR